MPIASFLLAASLLAACRGDDGRIVVRFLEASDIGGGWAEIIQRFEAAHPEIDVELVEGPASTNAREEMYTASFLSGDSSYDLVYLDVAWVAKFATRGWLQPLDDRFPTTERSLFLPGDIEGSLVEGQIYRVPMQADAGMLYYRSDLVAKPPETFDELAAAARAAQDPPARWGFVFQGLQYEGLATTFLEVLWGFGGDVFDQSGQVVLDRPPAVRALTWLAALVGDLAPEGVTTYQEEEARLAFQEGRAVFMRNWPYAWTMLQEEDSPVRGQVGIAPLVHAPGVRSAATLGGWGFGLASAARHPEAVWRFIEFATASAQQKTLHVRNGRIPTRRALFSDPDILAKSPHYPQLYEILLTARPRPVHPQYAQISSVLQSHVSAALVGREAPTAALEHAAGRIRAIVSR